MISLELSIHAEKKLKIDEIALTYSLFLFLGLDTKSSATEESVKVMWKKKRKVFEDKANAAFILENSNAVAFRWMRGKFMCAYCSNMCANVSEIRTHSQTHEILDLFEVRNSFPLRIDITDLKCRLCNKNVEDLNYLKTHLFEIHSKKSNDCYTDGVIPFILTGTEFRCVICKDVYESFMSLLIHMNSHLAVLFVILAARAIPADTNCGLIKNNTK